MKKIVPLLIFVIFFLVSVPAAYACTTNSDCPGNGTCNVSTGICATPNDTAGTGAGFATPATTIQTTAPATTNNTASWTGSSGTFTNASNFVPLTNIPGLIGTNGITNAQGLTAFFNDLYKICIGVAATLAVLQIMRAGIMYMGGDSITETKEARALIATAIGGLLLVLSPVIVFSIINPKILSLNVGLSNLTPPATTQTTAAPVANASNQICNGYSPTQWSEIPSGSSCNASLGAAWAGLQDVCCTGTQQPGAVCCGKNIDYVAPVTPALLSANQFSIAYQSTNYDTGKACIAYSDQGNFATQAACITAFNKVLSASKGATAVAESCTDTGSHTPTGTGWNTLKSLPSCPSQ